MFRSNRPFVPVKTDKKIYTTEIGIVNEVFPHSEAKDKANYQCNLTLRDSSVFLKEVPVATQHIGLTSIPKVGDLVLVSFLNGDLNRPVVTGTLYHSKGIAPLNAEGEITYIHRDVKEDKQEVPPKKDDKKPRRLHMMLPSGMTLTVRDEEVYYRYDKYQMDLKKEDGLKYSVLENEKKDAKPVTTAAINKDGEIDVIVGKEKKTSLQINKDGDVTIKVGDATIAIKKDGEINIDSKKKVGITTSADVELTSSGGNMKLTANKISMEGKQGFEIKSNGALEMKGATAKMESQGSLDLKGATAKMESQGPLDIKGAIVAVKASGVANIEASGPLALKGAIVNIN
jgi:hypothetical protein